MYAMDTFFIRDSSIGNILSTFLPITVELQWAIVFITTENKNDQETFSAEALMNEVCTGLLQCYVDAQAPAFHSLYKKEDPVPIQHAIHSEL